MRLTQWLKDGFICKYNLGRSAHREDPRNPRSQDDPIGQVLRNQVAREGWEPVIRRLMKQRDDWEIACERAYDGCEAERARSAKLIEAFENATTFKHDFEDARALFKEALAEYESSK